MATNLFLIFRSWKKYQKYKMPIVATRHLTENRMTIKTRVINVHGSVDGLIIVICTVLDGYGKKDGLGNIT